MIRPLLIASMMLIPGLAAAQPDPKKPDPPKLVTRFHELKAILTSPSRPPELTDPDAIVRLLLENVRFGDLKSDGDGPQLFIRDGGKLEVRTTEKLQGDIKEVLDALTRLGDIAIDVKADLIEFDKDAFEKDVKPVLKPAKGKTESPAAIGFGSGAEAEPGAEKPLPVAAVDKVAKAGKLIQTSTGRFANGGEATVSGRQSVFTYRTQPGGNPLFAKEGYRLGAVLAVSGDRRFVRAKLMEQSAEVVGVKKRNFGMFVATTPDISEFGRSATVEVEDGGAILFKLDYAPKDKVWVVVLKPMIFIQAEEDARKKEEKK